MRAKGSWIAVTLALVAFPASGCSGDERGRVPRQARAQEVGAGSRAAPARLPAPPSAAELAAEERAVRAAFRRARTLTAREVAELRQDVNAAQVATADSLGVRVSGPAEVTRLLRNGGLVPLGDSTRYWVLRDMDHSVPFVTPDARAMLVELGRRFHARLDRLGLPRYRMKVTSALRTDDDQAELRKINSYAAQTVSAHEFGTTVDVSHERFAVPAGSGSAGPAAPPGAERTEMLEEVGKEHARVLQAELGRVILELRGRGVLHVMMENRQPVYHMTVARRAAAPPAPR